MEANLYINGVIGSFDDENGKPIRGFELLDIIQQVKKFPQAESYKVYINSEGGLVDTGFEIYYYLKSLNKSVHTIGHGMVASIATVIFMAGEKRSLKPNTDFFIHLPSGSVQGTSEDIQAYAEMIVNEQKKILKFYNDYTDLTDEALLPLLRNETTLTVEQAYDLGFANTQPLAVEPVAYFNTNINNKHMNLTAEDKGWFEKQFTNFSKLFKSAVTNITETTADGETMIEFPDIEEGQSIPLGAKATIDGNPAEGEYVMPSGNTFVFVAGELTEIKEADSQEDEAEGEDEMLAFIEDLKKQLITQKEATATAKKDVATAKKETENLKSQIQNLKEEYTNFQTQLKTKLNFTSKKDGKAEDANEDKKSEAIKAYEAIKNKRKK